MLINSSSQPLTLVWKGQGTSPGVVEGTARVIRTPEDFEGVCEETIMVTRHATPALLPYLLKARGVACERGGILSHLAVLARELRKPCVTGLPGIMEHLEQGARVSLDGAKGILSVVSPHVGAGAVAPEPPPAAAGEVAVLQFGLFSAAFEYVGPAFDIDTALRAAALVNVPPAFGVGPPLRFRVEGHRLLTEAGPLRAAADVLASKLADGSPEAARLRRLYCDLVDWGGWGAPAEGATHERAWLGEALPRFAALNQITWAASITRDRLADIYHAFLTDALPGVEEGRRRQLFLDSLIMPARSYILRQGRRAGMADDPRASVAPGRRLAAALRELESRLDGPRFRRAEFLVSSLAHLVEITERKNTDLRRRAEILSGSDARREAVASLCGARSWEGAAGGGDGERGRLIEEVARRSRGWSVARLESLSEEVSS